MIFDFEFDSNVSEREYSFEIQIIFFLNITKNFLSFLSDRGTFYLDNGHSFDNILFYGNENLLFLFELMFFQCIVIFCGNYLFAILLIGVFYQVILGFDV